MNNKKIFNGLSSSAYTDKLFWTKEAETVFANNWVFVGYKHEFNNVGDVIPINISDKPILLVKNNKDDIAAFHNVCSHRCIKLVDQPKNFFRMRKVNNFRFIILRGARKKYGWIQ